MNKCHVQKELSAYLDNQLPESEKISVEQHLKECKICSEELKSLKLVSDKLKAWQVAGLGPEFDNAIRNEIVARELERGRVKMKKRTLAILVPSGVLAGILVLVFFNSLMKFNMMGKTESSRLEMERKKGILGGVLDYSISGKDATNRDVYYADRAGYKPDLLQPKPDKWSTSGAAWWEAHGSREAKIASTFDNLSQSSTGSVIVIQPLLPATGEGEKIIRTAEVRLQVEDGKETYKKATQICQELGGYLANSNFYKDEKGREAGTITMRIPKDNFLTALDKLSGLGKVDGSSTQSQDVSQEYANLKSRLDAEMFVYKKMLEALEKRQTTIPEAIRLESELTPVLRRIEELKNKIESLNNAVSFTTVTLYFHEPEVSLKVLKESRRFIQERLLSVSIEAVKFLAAAIPVLILAVVLLVAVAVLLILAKYWLIRLFKRK